MVGRFATVAPAVSANLSGAIAANACHGAKTGWCSFVVAAKKPRQRSTPSGFRSLGPSEIIGSSSGCGALVVTTCTRYSATRGAQLIGDLPLLRLQKAIERLLPA